MEKNGKCRYYLPEKWRFLKGLTRLLMLICLVNLPVHVFSQEKRFSFEFTNVPVSTVFLNIEKNSDYSFVYNSQELQKIGLKDYKFENATVREILETCLK